MVNEPSVFKSFKVYCSWWHHVLQIKISSFTLSLFLQGSTCEIIQESFREVQKFRRRHRRNRRNHPITSGNLTFKGLFKVVANDNQNKKYICIPYSTYYHTVCSGPSCSKLTTSLVNDSLKFTSSDTQIF